MLDSRSAIVVDVFLDLTLSLTGGRLIDGHLDGLVVIGNDNRAESRVLSVHHLIINRPEAMELECALVPLNSGNHLVIGLVTDAMVNEAQIDGGSDVLKRVTLSDSAVAGQEDTLVVLALDECVVGGAVCANRGDHDNAIVILELGGLQDRDGTALDGQLVNSARVLDGEGNILDTITVLRELLGKGLIVGVIGRDELEDDLECDNQSSE
jgi:hypothetical protein